MTDVAIAQATRGPRIGYFRVGVYRDAWDRLVQTVESGFGPVCFEVTRRALVLADSTDGLTGWFNPSFTDTTIKGIMVDKAATRLQLAVGAYVTYDKSFLTADVLRVDDQVKSKEDVYYEVRVAKEIMEGDSFSHRVCGLSEIPLYAE